MCSLAGQGQDPQPHQPAAGVPAQPRGVALRAGGSHPAAQGGGPAAAGTAALLGKPCLALAALVFSGKRHSCKCWLSFKAGS